MTNDLCSYLGSRPGEFPRLCLVTGVSQTKGRGKGNLRRYIASIPFLVSFYVNTPLVYGEHLPCTKIIDGSDSSSVTTNIQLKQESFPAQEVYHPWHRITRSFVRGGGGYPLVQDLQQDFGQDQWQN